MSSVLSGSKKTEKAQARFVRDGRRSWGLMAFGVVLFIAAALLFWWGFSSLPQDIPIIKDIERTTPLSQVVERAQASVPNPRPSLTTERKTQVPGSAFRQHAAPVPRANRKERVLKAYRQDSARLKPGAEREVDLRAIKLNQELPKAAVETQTVADAQPVIDPAVAAAPLSNSDDPESAPETLLPADAALQVKAPLPSATPAFRCPRIGKKPNIFRRIINSIIGIFKKRQPTYVPNQPPIVNLSSSSATITLPCPWGSSQSRQCPTSDAPTIQLAANATDPDRDKLLYTYTTTGGRVTGDGANVSWDLAGVQPGTYTATVEVDDGCGGVVFSSTTVTIAGCTDCVPPCPTVSISCPTDRVQAGTQATMSVSLTGGDPNAAPTYNWSVSAGTISSGQGTPTITVDTTGIAGPNVTAIVEIGGLPPECQRSASCSFSLFSLAPPYSKFDEYAGLEFKDERGRLNNFAIQLQQEPSAKGYYVIFGSCEGEAAQRSALAVAHLVNNGGIHSDRISVISGGCRETLTVELWICQAGAPAPPPSNSASVNPCPDCKAKPRPRGGGRSVGISGTVLDQNNRPIPGAIVVAIDKNGMRSEPAITDSNGNFTITGLLPGDYTLSVTYSGSTREKSVSVIRNQITQVPPISLPVDVTTTSAESSLLTVLREVDRIKATYPSKFLKDTASTVTFNLERVLVFRDIVKSQNINTNAGTYEIIDQPRTPAGAKKDTVTPINEGVYDTYIRVELSATGLVIPQELAVQERLYRKANEDPNSSLKQDWTWSVTPIPGFAGDAELRFKVSVIWRSVNHDTPDRPPVVVWEQTVPADIGESALLVYGSMFGSPVVAIGAFGAFGVGAKRRRKLLAGDVEADGVEEQPPEPPAQPEVEDEVTGTAYAPARAGPGDGFLVQVFLHLPEQASLLEAMAKEFDEDARKADYAKLKEKIKRGTELTLFLEMPGLEIEDPAQSCVWQGELERVRFGVTVPEDFAPKDILAKVTVTENSIPIGHLRFKMKIGKTITAHGEADASSTQSQIPVGNLNRYKQAFISYASKDRREVTKRVQMLNLVKIKFFQDLLTLEPGDPFEKLIYQYIDESDVFFLFWSTAASQSEWVLREVEYAIKRKSENAENPPEIIPVIIEGPPPAKPPAELNFLHFNDRFMYFINTRETEAKPDSE